MAVVTYQGVYGRPYPVAPQWLGTVSMASFLVDWKAARGHILALRVLALALVLSGCARRPEPLSTPVLHDKSVTFPLPSAHDEVPPGAAVLDGEALRALMIAADDLFPPGLPVSSCRNRKEAYTYRVVRQDEVIFVYIEANPSYCGESVPAMDSGAKYAISKDGRILRRVVDGLDEDDAIWRLKRPDGGVVTVITEPGVVPDAAALDAPDSGILKVYEEPAGPPAQDARDAGQRDGGLPR